MTDTGPTLADSRRPSPAAILAVVGFSVFIAADDLTVVSTMLRPIIGDLGLILPDGLDEAAWIVNAYLVAFVAIMPIAGRISDVIGRRRAILVEPARAARASTRARARVRPRLLAASGDYTGLGFDACTAPSSRTMASTLRSTRRPSGSQL